MGTRGCEPTRRSSQRVPTLTTVVVGVGITNFYSEQRTYRHKGTRLGGLRDTVGGAEGHGWGLELSSLINAPDRRHPAAYES